MVLQYAAALAFPGRKIKTKDMSVYSIFIHLSRYVINLENVKQHDTSFHCHIPFSLHLQVRPLQCLGNAGVTTAWVTIETDAARRQQEGSENAVRTFTIFNIGIVDFLHTYWCACK
jgi:hypothetical protein